MTIPNETLKPKVALIRDGKVPTTLGRGRMSSAQKDRIAELVSEGWKIEGYPAPPSNTATAQTPVAERVVRVAPPNVKAVIEPKPEVRDRKTFAPFVSVNGKQMRYPLGPAAVCDNCRNSFTHCSCGDPRAMYEGKSIPVWFQNV